MNNLNTSNGVSENKNKDFDTSGIQQGRSAAVDDTVTDSKNLGAAMQAAAPIVTSAVQTPAPQQDRGSQPTTPDGIRGTSAGVDVAAIDNCHGAGMHAAAPLERLTVEASAAQCDVGTQHADNDGVQGTSAVVNATVNESSVGAAVQVAQSHATVTVEASAAQQDRGTESGSYSADAASDRKRVAAGSPPTGTPQADTGGTPTSGHKRKKIVTKKSVKDKVAATASPIKASEQHTGSSASVSNNLTSINNSTNGIKPDIREQTDLGDIAIKTEHDENKDAKIECGPSLEELSIEKGMRVLVRYSKEGVWMWGKIISSYKVRKSIRYSVQVESGDILSNVARKNIKIPTSEPCMKCVMCCRKPCGKCCQCRGGCRNACLQKMCCEWEELEKAVDAQPYFPEGWKFFFEGQKEVLRGRIGRDIFEENRGLVLVSPSDAQFFSVENAIAYNPSCCEVDVAAFKDYVGLNGNDTDKKKSVTAGYRRVGMRCYAKWINDQWYWGKITRILGSGKNAVFSVHFDDGDKLDGIRFEDLIMENEYNTMHKSRSSSLTKDRDYRILQELWEKRCGVCSMCTKDDCGRCRSCIANSQSTNVQKEVCLFKMCLKIPEKQRYQPVPVFSSEFRFLEQWKFIITEPLYLPQSISSDTPYNPALAGFCLIAPSGKKLRGLEKVAALQDLNKSTSDRLLGEFYESVLGLDLSTQEEHYLVGKAYMRQWIDNDGNQHVVYGKLIECRREHTGMMRFTVVYDEDSRTVVNQEVSTFHNHVPERDDSLVERDAWGGYFLAYQTASLIDPTVESPSSEEGPSRYFHWLTPSEVENRMVRFDEYMGIQLPCRTLTFQGYKIMLQAKESSIPNSGFGVWASCLPVDISQPHDQYFELRPGHMLDIGIYSPLRIQDRKEEHISVLKNFIHNWECESYNFDVARHERSGRFNVLDITDDVTGQLHREAQKCVTPYVNETSSEDEPPSIHAEHDPSGAVHYLLGHYESSFGAFRLPCDGSEIEVKVDYGPSYEKIRVRKGYPRVGKQRQKQLWDEIKQDDIEVVEDIFKSSAREVVDDVRFLEKIWKKSTNFHYFPETKRRRLLLLALLLRIRVLAIQEEFGVSEGDGCANQAVNSMLYTKSSQRTKNLISDIVSTTWETAELLHSSMVSEEVCLDVLRHVFKCKSIGGIREMQPEAFYERILEI